MKLKMCTTGKTFCKICLKTIRDNFFQHVVCNQRRDVVKHEGNGEDSIFWWGVTSNRRVRSKVLGMSENPILIPPEKNAKECAWSEYCNNFEKSEREYIFFRSNKFTACKVRDGKGVAKSLMVFILRKIIHPFKNKRYLRT